MARLAVVFESFVRAGSQRHLVEILKGITLYRDDVECTLFLIAPSSQNWSSFSPEVLDLGIPIDSSPYIYDRLDGSSLKSRIHNWVSRNYRERHLNSNFYDRLSRFDSIVCAQPFVADLLLPHLGPHHRLCFHLMEHLAQRSNSWNYGLLRRRRLHLIYMHVSQISQLRSHRSHNPTITWPVRLCPDHLQESPTVIPDDCGVLRIAHYSRISPMRLIDQLIDAFALLRQRTKAILHIAGFIEDPDYHNSLLTQVKRLEIANAVFFVDPVPKPGDDPARSQVDLVWMISLSRHVGYAAIEAMAAGLPTLLLEVDSHASASPEDPELSDLICANPGQLVERSLSLQTDPSAFRRQQAQLVRNRFLTTKESIDELTAFYLGHP